MNKSNSAIAAAFLSLCFAFILVSVNTISLHLQDSFLIPNIPYGASLVCLSLITLLAAVTSPSRDRAVVVCVILSLAAFRTAIGFSYIFKELAPLKPNTNTSDFSEREVLLPGYGAYVLIYLVFAALSVTNKHFRSTSILTTISLLLSVFGIVDIIIEQEGTEIIHILMAIITAYLSVSYILQNFNVKNVVSPSEDQNKNRKGNVDVSDFVIFKYVMNVVAFSVFASMGTSMTESTKYGFVWPFTSGIFLVVTGSSALRRSSDNAASTSIFDGLFWLSVGGSLFIEYILYSESVLPITITIVISIFFIALMIVSVKSEILLTIHYLNMFIFVLALGIDGTTGTFLSVIGWIGLLISLYGIATHLSSNLGLSIPFYTGKDIFQKEKLKRLLTFVHRRKITPSDKTSSFAFENMLGYSKYISADSVGFGVNVIAASSIIWIPSGSETLILPWTLGFGGLIQFLIGFVSFSRGQTFEGCSFILYASFWSIWGVVRGLDLIDGNEGAHMSVGCISFFVTGLLFLGLSSTVSKMWFSLHIMFNILVLEFIFVAFGVPGHIFGSIVTAVYSAVFMYAFLSASTAKSFGREILPTGKPLVQISHLHSKGDSTMWTNSRRATGVKSIADLLKGGKICGIPTDTVYVLVAACNRPQAVERAYKTKKQAEDRPMSLWISNLRQIESAKSEFGEILWSFLQEIWPSNISAVVKKGEWMDSFGLKDSEKYVGRPDSIAIRIPNNTVVCHLIDQTGPIAVTSANPTGEADTTHHLQVLAKLGTKNCDGILCDGPSHENAASTVVDCRNISEGTIGFFRIGLTPKSKVQEIFNRVLKKHKHNSITSVDSVGDSGISDVEDKQTNVHVNRAFEADENTAASLSLRGKKQINSSHIIGGKSQSTKSTIKNPLFTN